MTKPAFPTDTIYEDYQGMTLRDYFAAKAMQGMLSSHNCPARIDCDEFAKQSYNMANAMMEARNATNT